ncbi:alpha/beta hydrolase [Mycolicibacterium psychrotolerans]|uniref:alpha/beta hydrolase n=1 Tax=Mycolicibacterium psychrotolerans TaxID=216929 RepID=UPI003D66ACDE
MRTNSSFISEGVRCDAWGFNPGSSGRVPMIVMGHGLGATKSMRLSAYAERFVAAGYACLAFDYRHFGASEGLPRQLLSVKRQLADWHAAIAYARSLPGVDPDRIVAWGTSFGGGHALSMAEQDRRLAAAIAQCPFTDGVASAMAVDPITSARVTIAAVRDRLRAVRGAKPIYLPNAAEPGTPSFMNAPDALPGMSAIAADAPDFDNRLTARSAFDVMLYGPGRHAKDIGCPVYVALCDPDTVAPNKTAARQLAKSPLAEVHTYPVGHFDIYLGQHFETAVADYITFINKHVPVRP